MSVIAKVKNVNCKTGNHYLLHDINWEIHEGEHWLIFGMNGCGKTTLLSLLAGYKSPSSGSIEVFGKEYTKETIFEMRKKVGWVSGSFFDKLYKNETTLQIILSGLTGTYNIDDSITAIDVQKAKKLMRALHIEEKMNAPFSNLSKGERQNVLIARALINDPKILVLDEPGTGLDVYARENMKSIVKNLAEHKNVTILYVTHYPEEIQPFMNKTLLLRNGCVYAKGDTAEIFKEERLSRLFGEPTELIALPDGSMTLRFNTPDIFGVEENEEVKI